MKKKLYFFALLLFAGMATAFAAQPRVQGIPHKNAVMPKPLAVTPNVDFRQIKYWVGEGTNKSALVVKWCDGKGGDTNLVWGYKWDDEATGYKMLCDVAAADPRFYLLVYAGTQYGAAIGGFGFDIDCDGDIALVDKAGATFEPENGVYDCQDYSFDDFSAIDADDHWGSGWYSGYWSYWVADNVNSSFGYSGVGASSRKLSDGSVDGWVFMANFASQDMTGEPEYVTAPKTPLADYTQGVFVVNEDWYGHQNSTLNFLKDDGEWIYRVVQQENPGIELGCTNQFGAIYGNNFYLIAKQDKDPGASINGGRVTVCRTSDMTVLKQIRILSADPEATNGPDGRGFMGVDEHKGYIGSSDGIFVFDLDNLTITGKITGTENGADNAYDELYGGQIGTMVRVNEYVYAVHQAKGLLVIDPTTDEVIEVIEAPAGKGFGSVVLSKDGNLWLSMTLDNYGTADNSIMKLDPATHETTVIALPDGINGPANSWYAWTPDGFCASTQSNVLYWNGGDGSWFSGYRVFKFDIDNGTFTKIIDLEADGEDWQIYGCSMRVDPETDELYTSLFHSFGDQTYIFRHYDADGNKIEDFSMIANYWFPSLPVFPDVAKPVIADLEATISLNEPTTLSLEGIVTDDDNIEASIVKTVKAIENGANSEIEAEIVNGNLLVTPIKASATESCKILLQANSNGKLCESYITVKFDPNTGVAKSDVIKKSFVTVYGNEVSVSGVASDSNVAVYSAAGALVTTAKASAGNAQFTLPSAGLYIVKVGNETTKIIIK